MKKHSANWKGGHVNHQGYIRVYVPEHPNADCDGYVFEHRLVMENHLCQYLSKYDDVHHINGIRDDNRIENLVCISRTQHRQMTTHTVSDEVKRRISIANSGPNNGMWGKKVHLSDEAKRKISIANSGSKNGNWGGVGRPKRVA